METTTQKYSKHVSVPAGQGVRVEKSITIDKPVAEVYAFWHYLPNLPRFMRHVESVTMQDPRHSHWTVNTIADKRLEWDAEVIEERPNEMLSWRSTPGADVDNAGSVWFTPAIDGRGTSIKVELKYMPPAGKAGALIAKAFGRDADAEIEEDLGRLKSLLETGRVPEATNAGRLDRMSGAVRQRAQKVDRYFRQNPWTMVLGMAAGGLALGFILGWRLGFGKRQASEYEYYELVPRQAKSSRAGAKTACLVATGA